MPLFESEHEKRSRIYREQQRNIDRNIQWQTDRIKAQDSAARSARIRANERAARARSMDRAATLIGGAVGLAGWALKKDEARQERLRQERAAQASQQPQQAPGAPQAPGTPTAPSSPHSGAQQAYTAPGVGTEVPPPPYVGPQAQTAEVPLVNNTQVTAGSIPWGIFSIILGAMFFFAPVTSFAGIALGIVGLRQNVNGNPTQRKLNLIGIGISVLVLLGFLFLWVANLLLTGLVHVMGG